MKSLILAISLLSISSQVSAAPCSPSSTGPCTPVQDDGYRKTHAAILRLIGEAVAAEPDVTEARENFLHIRGKHYYSAENQMNAFLQYRDAITAQDSLYEKALNKTADLYHVRPKNTGRFTIGEPAEASRKYMTGLSAIWNPKVTDSGPGVKLAVRIDGNDRPHYTGATKLNPGEPGGRFGTTLDDGRVLIMKDTFAIAAYDMKNLGFLAAVIYHETHHYDRLSWKDKTGKNRSWATPDEEERDAYAAEARMGRIFGLSDADIEGLKSQSRKYANAVKTGVPITDDHLTPAQEKAWENQYKNVQINLEEEYAALQRAVKEETAAQLVERDRRLAAERQRREHATENARQWAAYYRQTLTNEAAACGYTLIIRSRETDAVMGIKGLQQLHHFSSDGVLPFNIRDLKIVLQLTRICDAVQSNYKQELCNDSTPDIRERASTSELKAQLDHILGAPNPNLIDAKTRGCVDYFISNSAIISDAKSLGKVIAKYHRKLADEKRAYDKIWHSGPKTPPARGGGGGGSRPPSNEGDYIFDPGCNCWIRRY